ncbi:cysteine--tRNA ligase [Ahrensia kielensis]|uniref:Cysteine--tRNA ligase n=1 Tax=Ahrensia kielensis TaxID=76980 RepID=A0ABU9T302_9HYPH
MDLRLHNTLTRSKETFEPIDAKNVRMYVCGPTVYDYAHIGNARPVIVFDVLYRLLRHIYGEEHVTYVRNITDVDDKINARALRDFPDLPLNEAIRNVTEKTANQFHKDVEALGCWRPNHEPRATEFVLPRADGKSDMATLIQKLLDKNHAYVATGKEGREVLFDVTSMDNYGALSNRKLEDQQAGARIEAKDHKKNAGDFVLWKESSANEPGWDATFNGEIIHGRPGWHIECSAMSAAFFGEEEFDIHGGGLDLIFPHHENEIAQSCCAHGTKKMANIWMHNGYLQVEGKKMSKSVGNFVTIHELLHTEKFGGRKWPGEVLRLAMLMTHYREPIDFSVKRLEEAYSLSRLLQNAVRKQAPEAGEVPEAFLDLLKDDLNTPEAIQMLMKLPNRDAVAAANFLELLNKEDVARARRIREQRKEGDRHAIERAYTRAEAEDAGLDSDHIDQIVEERTKHLLDKNFAEADRIRDELLSQGIQLKDSKDSVTGERVTTWEIKR